MPPSLQDWLPSDDLAYFLLDAVDQFDLKPFYAAYRADGVGQAAFQPHMMVALLLYAYCPGVRSSRQIERLCQRDVAFRVVAGNLRPDHATIARFRQRHTEALKGLFTDILRPCPQAGLVPLLTSDRPRAKLAAAEALARCGGPGALPAVWDALAAGPDRVLGHALIHAAHRIADADALLAVLGRPEPAVQAAALRLLDQPPRPRDLLDPGPVVERLGSSNPALRDAALWVLRRHPDWSGAALDHLRGRLRAAPRRDE